MKHGILLSQNLVIFTETQEEFDELLHNLTEAHKPENQSELVLVEKMAIALWKQKRLIAAESAQIASQQISSRPPQHRDQKIQEEANLRHAQQQGLPLAAERYVRYDSLLERQYYAALTMLQRVQALRQNAIEADADKKAIAGEPPHHSPLP